MGSTKRIAKNTLLLYLRMMIVMFINLFAVRIVMNALGEVDYGLYNVIAGVITMMSSVTGVLAGAAQRYYSYAMGENKQDSLSEIFSAIVNIYAILSLIVIVLGETVGLWFVNNQLVIPPERLRTANWVYQFTIISFVFGMMQTPYLSSMIAHEEMGVFAVVSLVECLLKFGTACLLLIIGFDRLFVYGALIMLAHAFCSGIYVVVGRRRHKECRYRRVKTKSYYGGLLSFSGWTLLGSLAGVGMNQVLTMLVNVFFGPVANAAQAIAMQINGALSSFCGSFIMAIRPPMIKAYAEKEYRYLDRLFTLSNKIIYYLLLFIALILFFEMEEILTLWLKSTTEQTVLFSRLIVIYTMVLALNNPITIIIQATGKVKEYYIPVEIPTLLCPVVTWILFKVGGPAECAFYAMIGAIVISHIVRLFRLRKFYPGFSIQKYLRAFVSPAIAVTAVSAILLLLVFRLMPGGLLRLGVVAVSSLCLVFVLAALIGLDREEKVYLRTLVLSKLNARREVDGE